MGKFRAKTKTGKNRQRWKKGQSSSSNPNKTKHRDAAKARLLRVGFGQTSEVPKGFNNAPARLTAESLLKHDALMGTSIDETPKEEDLDAVTLGQTNKTFDTFASSVWSNCSNVSFGRLLPRFNPSNPKHKEMLAILSAISDVIKEEQMSDDHEGNEPSGVEYFGALLTTLDTTEDSENLSATISLLSIIIKTIDKELLRAKFSIAAKLFLELLTRHGESEDASIVRGLLGCLSIVLRAQDSETWKNSSTIRVLDSILSFCVDRRPKVRKAAHHAVCAILAAKDETEDFHPASEHIAKFLNNLMKTHTGGNDSKAVLHVLILLKEVIFLFPKSMVKSVCESILLAMKLGNSLTSSCCFQALHGLFSGRPSAKCLPGDTNARLISALYDDFQPSINDGQPMICWLTVMQEAHINLSMQDPMLCLENLPKFFVNATKCWRSDRGEVSVAATAALKAILNEAIKPNLGNFNPNQSETQIKAIFASVENGLAYQFYNSWAQVLNILTTFFDVCGGTHYEMMGKCLKSLADLRSSANFTLTNELDYVIGKAIRTMGPEVVVKHIPLQITGKEESYEFPRSWLLPVLRENIQNANLSFFKTYFLPMAMACQARASKAENENDKIGQKSYEMLVSQIWSLLPGFCNNPKDLKESFNDIVKHLGKNLQDRKDLRMYILASLRQLILKNVDNEENKAVLGKWAIKFLDTMCNLYLKKPSGAEESGQRSSIMETIKLFLTLVDPSQLGGHFKRLFDTIKQDQSPTVDEFTREACHDLLRIFLHYQDYKQIEEVYQLASSTIGNKDHKKQKKAYKLLEEICASESESCQKFLQSNLETIQKTLLNSLSKASPPSQASRIRCLINIVRQLKNGNANQEQFLFKIVPEAILCVKAANEKARSGSYTLLVVIGETLQKWRSEDEIDTVIKDYMKVILAGLAGGPTMIHCTLKAITRIFYEFHDLFPDELTEMLVENVCLLLTSHSREIVNPSVSFLHVFITTSPVMGSAKYCEKIVSALCKMTEDCKRHFRLKTRYLFDRLVRRFGYDVIKNIIPKDDEMTLKRLKNIKKIQARKKQKDVNDQDSDNDDDDVDSEFRIKSKPKTIDEILAMADGLDDEAGADEDEENEGTNKKVQKRHKKKQSNTTTYITEEANGDSIVDFLDASAAQKVRRSKPNVVTKANSNNPAMKKGNEFEIAPDGRLIIKDSDDDEVDTKPHKGYMLEDSDDENEETFASMVSTNARKRKRGGSVASSKRSEPAMKYKAGGSGIHRPLDANSKKNVFEYGSEYKATKAKGDMKRKNKPDPYAYVPLQKSSLNRRKKAKFEGQFKGLVKAAEKGSSQGKKAKSLNKRMKNLKMK